MPNIAKLLSCPRCGAQDIQHYEEAIVARNVAGYDEAGTLWIDGFPNLGDGDNERLHCCKCQCEWPLPEDVDFN